MYIDYFPLEEFRKENDVLDSKLERLFPWTTTACWRGYNGIWKIENDSLFLIEIGPSTNDGEYNHIDLSNLFDKSKISNNGVFAFWFSKKILANYGDYLDFDEYSWSSIYSGEFNCKVTNGIVSDIEIKMKSKTEIDMIRIRKKAEEDTMICLVVEEYPILLTNERKYKTIELQDFVQKQIRHNEYVKECTGRVFISFVVEKNGIVSKKRIIRKLCHEQDKEAMRILELMNNWEPGKNNGKVVRTQITLPIKFGKE